MSGRDLISYVHIITKFVRHPANISYAWEWILKLTTKEEERL